MYVSVGLYAFQFSFARIEPLFLLIKLTLVSIGIEQQAFCPCGCLAHPFADFFNGEFYGCFYDDFVVDVHHDLFVFEVLHGVSEEVSSGCLDDVFDKLRPVGFNSLPPLIHSDTLIGDRCAAELVFSELGFHVRQAFYVSQSESSIGYLGSSEMLDIDPNPVKFVNENNPIVEKLTLQEKTVLISRSGTIGNVTFVGKTLAKHLVSEHAIRLIHNQFQGYVSAYLKTQTAQHLMQSEQFGSVILEIDPNSLCKLPIPNASESLKTKIHNLIVRSYELRDESNEKMHTASDLLVRELGLPPIEELENKSRDYSKSITAYSMRSKDLNGRLEASFHDPIKRLISELIVKKADLLPLGNESITKKIILPGRFKRIYTEPNHGVVFIGGKEIGALDPCNKKYISLSLHSKRIKEELLIEPEMILVTCSGTIGKVALVPEHWNHWTVNQHVLRVVPRSDKIGILYCWLSSSYGKKLITGLKYGSVVDEITDAQLSSIPVPVFQDSDFVGYINELVLDANKMRHEAYQLEQEAIRIMNEEVLGISDDVAM